MPKSGSAKISLDKARKPRSHENMVVFTFGARKNMELPFILGVMADLSGKAKQPLPSVSQRKFLEIDSGNFDARMAAIRPRVAFAVPNQMTPEGGNLTVDLEFESMDDFKPDRVARKIEPLRPLLEQREALKNLESYLSGKEDAEKLLEDLLKKIDALSK
jgi:type VI secretion system protein ImpB